MIASLPPLMSGMIRLFPSGLIARSAANSIPLNRDLLRLEVRPGHHEHPVTGKIANDEPPRSIPHQAIGCTETADHLLHGLALEIDSEEDPGGVVHLQQMVAVHQQAIGTDHPHVIIGGDHRRDLLLLGDPVDGTATAIPVSAVRDRYRLPVRASISMIVEVGDLPREIGGIHEPLDVTLGIDPPHHPHVVGDEEVVA